MKTTKKTGVIAFALVLVMLSVFTLLYQNENTIPITGYAPAGVFVFSSDFLVCDFTVNQGWSLISIPCFSTYHTVSSFINILGADFTSIHWYDPSDTSDQWKAYNPSIPAWVIQDLDRIEKEKGYWIDMPESRPFFYSGTKATPVGISIKRGWNLIGYPTNYSQLINETIPFNYTSVHKYNLSDTIDPWKVYYNPPNATNDLQYFDLYFGYWIKSNEELLWIVNW